MTMNIKITNTSDNADTYQAAITVKEGKEVVDKIVLDPGETSDDILIWKGRTVEVKELEVAGS